MVTRIFDEMFKRTWTDSRKPTEISARKMANETFVKSALFAKAEVKLLKRVA
jgi:hypothetical protein